MNERIDDLFVQARFAAGSEKQFNATMRDVYHKFAELIMKEVCQKLEDDGMVEIAMEMKQHFGVEQ